MATATTTSFQWIPEDDILLKNAVEAGASLEALAKGAVPFSRRYTLREVRERWHSLLYDPDVSAQAAEKISELEKSGINTSLKFNRSDNSLVGSKEVSQKRKSSSIRRKYYAMRKKFRSELFSNSDLGFFEPNPHEFSEQSADFRKQVMHGMTDHLRLQEEDLDILRHAFPETIGDIDRNGNSSITDGGNNILDVNIKNRKPSMVGNPQHFDPSSSDGFSSLQTIMFPSDQPHLHHWSRMQDVSASDTDRIAEDEILHDVEGKENSSTVGVFADPDSLLNLSNEDEMLMEEVDEKCAANKCPADNLAVQDSTKGGHENDTSKTELESVTVTEVIPPTVSEVATSSVHEDQQMNSQSEVDAPSNVTSSSDFSGLGSGKICCILNTEDTEIPCNDDIFLLIHPSTSFGTSATQPNSISPMTSSSHEKDYEQALNYSMRANDSAKSSMWPESRIAETEIHDSRMQALRPGLVTHTIRDFSKGGPMYVIPKQCSNSKKEVAGVDMKDGQNPTTVSDLIRSTEAGSSRSQHLEPVDDDSVSVEESEIDDDVPYFSDIEAMILEMDLDPYDQDSGIVRKVPSYQYENTKRTIIRLDQGACSSSRRAMTSHGALAVLYGRHLRHYIRKTEVLLGRSTDDIDVDIDLGKEGRANKISRRQAIIKMESDGSFFLKNLGKSSVSVNGVPVASGQLLNLNTSCLIEIRGMSFVFEINQDYVKKNLAKFFLKNKGKTGKSDWSAEGESGAYEKG